MSDAAAVLSREDAIAIERLVNENVPFNDSQGYLRVEDLVNNVAECLPDGCDVRITDIRHVVDDMNGRGALRIIDGHAHPPLDPVENDW